MDQPATDTGTPILEKPQSKWQVSAHTPAYWNTACADLTAADAVLGRLIATYGQQVGLQSHGDAFVTLARSIVGQQISVKAAQAVWDRFSATLSDVISAPAVLAAAPEVLRAAGLSGRKVEYLRDLSLHFAQGHCQPQRWAEMEDEAIISELTSIRGIGRWTAEMFLIFHLMRPNVLPLDDVGLLKSIGLHYGDGQTASRSQARMVAQHWHPWCSVATWYLWRALDPLPVAY